MQYKHSKVEAAKRIQPSLILLFITVIYQHVEMYCVKMLKVIHFLRGAVQLSWHTWYNVIQYSNTQSNIAVFLGEVLYVLNWHLLHPWLVLLLLLKQDEPLAFFLLCDDLMQFPSSSPNFTLSRGLISQNNWKHWWHCVLPLSVKT